MIYTNSAVAAYWLAHVAGISAQAWSGAGGAAMRSVPTTNSSLGVPLPRVSGVRAPVAGCYTQLTMQTPHLIYFADAMCSWCYGFSPVIADIRKTLSLIHISEPTRPY